MPASRLNSKRQRGSRRSIDAVGTAPGQALGQKRRAVRDGRILSGDEIDGRGNGAHGEKTAALAGLALIVAGTGLTVARSVLVDMNSADPVLIVGEAMRGRGGLVEGQYGGRRRQT